MNKSLKLFKIATLIVVASLLSSCLAHATIYDGARRASMRPTLTSTIKPRFCNYVLSTFISANGDSEKLREISELVSDAQDIRETVKRPFTVMADLAAVFDSGLIFRALSSELRARGHKTRNEMEIALTLFSAMDEKSQEQIPFVHAVVNRMMQMIGPTNISMNDVKSIQKRAASLGFTPKEFTSLLQALGSQAKDNYVLVKLALLEELFSSHGRLPPAVEKEMSYFNSLTRFMHRDDLRGWANLPEAPIGRSEDADKIVGLKMAALKSQIKSNPSLIDTELESMLHSILNEYGFWLSDEYFESVQKDLFTFLIQVKTDDSFFKLLNSLYNLSFLKNRESISLTLALQELSKVYDGENRPRWEKVEALIASHEKQLADDLAEGLRIEQWHAAEQNRIDAARRAEEENRENERRREQEQWERDARNGRSYFQGCFTAETLVDTPNGQIPISQLKTGDLVFAFNTVTGSVEAEPVLKPLRHFSRDFLIARFSNGTTLKVTPEHPFYSPRLKQFVPLSELEVGEKVLVRTDVHSEQDLTVEIIGKDKGGNSDVYNIEVKTHHNYFVNGILVHNIKVS